MVPARINLLFIFEPAMKAFKIEDSTQMRVNDVLVVSDPNFPVYDEAMNAIHNLDIMMERNTLLRIVRHPADTLVYHALDERTR